MPADMGIYQAFGTRRTCTVQGSYIFFGVICTIIYYSNLSIFSYIAVNLDFKEERLRKFEPWLHVPPWLISAILTAVGVSKDYVKPAGPWCLPYVETEETPLSSAACYEEKCPSDAFFETYVKITFIIFCLSLLISTIMVVFIYRADKVKTRKCSKKVAGKGIITEKYRKQKAKQVVKQSLLYLISFYTWMFTSMLSRIIQSNKHGNKPHFPTLVIGVLAVSSQGIVLFLVYDRTRLIKIESEENVDSISPSSDSIITIADIERNIITNKPRAPTPRRRRSLKNLKFSIFDGTCPSSTYSEFVHSSDEGLPSEGPEESLRETDNELEAENNNNSSPVETVDIALLPTSLSESTQERNLPDNEESKTEEVAM